MNCPFLLKLSCSRDGQVLIVRSFVNEHYHEISEIHILCTCNSMIYTSVILIYLLRSSVKQLAMSPIYHCTMSKWIKMQN